MPTIGLPKIKIEFESLGLTAIQRSQRGIALLILKDSTKTSEKSYKYSYRGDYNKEDFSPENQKRIELAFEGQPHTLLVEIFDGTERILPDLLKDLILKKFNYYCAVGLEVEERKIVESWHKDIVSKNDKTCKLVTFKNELDDLTVENWETSWVNYEGTIYEGEEFLPLVTSTLAALPLTRSFTNYVWNKVKGASLDFAGEEDEAINKGKLFLTYDGDDYLIARGVNSLTTYSEFLGEDQSKIRIVEGMHLIKDDIRDTWRKFWAGKVLGKYKNKQQFISLVNRVYFEELKRDVLEETADNKVFINLEENRKYAITRGADVDKMTTEQIKTYNTGSNLFLAGNISLLDALEDLTINFKLD